MPKLKKYLVTTLDLTIHYLILKRMDDGEDMQARQASFLETHEYHERTCRIESTSMDETAFYYNLSCGHTLEVGVKPQYCYVCGAKVVDE